MVSLGRTKAKFKVNDKVNAHVIRTASQENRIRCRADSVAALDRQLLGKAVMCVKHIVSYPWTVMLRKRR